MEIEAGYSMQEIETIHLILGMFIGSKQHIIERGFKNDEEKIRFFKFQNPEDILASTYIYQNISK